MRSSLVLATALALITATAPLANAQNLVSNPGFETGDFTGWTQAGFSGLDGVGIPQHSGDYAGQFGAVSGTSSISQFVATSNGVSYSLSFWLYNPSDHGNYTFFGAYWGGNELMSLTTPGGFEWTQYAFNVQATDASTLLEFRFQHILSYWALDDVSVTTSESTVPEPATMTLLATGLAGLAAARKRRRNVA
jgi:hypothetical protein